MTLMEGEGLQVDIVAYNTLFDGYCKMGKFEESFCLYKLMYRRCVLPNLVSYTTLISGLCKDGRMKEAHQVFHRMIHRGLMQGFSPHGGRPTFGIFQGKKGNNFFWTFSDLGFSFLGFF